MGVHATFTMTIGRGAKDQKRITTPSCLTVRALCGPTFTQRGEPSGVKKDPSTGGIDLEGVALQHHGIRDHIHAWAAVLVRHGGFRL